MADLPLSAREPEEWRRLHPATFLLDLVRFLRAIILPALIIGVINRGRGDRDWLFYSFILLSVFGLIGSVARYASTRFGVAGGRLFVKSGVLFRVQRTIPADKIQNLHQESGVLHRLFQVVELRVETAGSGGAEATLAHVSKFEADRLRDELLAARREQVPEAEPAHLLRGTTPAEILLAGATETRVGLLLAIFFGLFDLAGDIGTDSTEVFQILERAYSNVALPAWVLAIAGIVAALLFGWVASIAVTCLTFFGFELRRVGRDLKKQHGLFTKVETTIPVPRIQALGFDANPLRQWSRLRRVRVSTAGSALDAEEGRTSVIAPIIPLSEGAAFCDLIYPDLDLSRVPLASVHPLAKRRGFTRVLLRITLPLVVIAFLRQEWQLLYGFPLALIIAILWARQRYRVLGYALAGRFVIVRSGVWLQELVVVPKEKLQGVAIRRTLIQRFLGLASFELRTAGRGPLSRRVIPDLGEPEAEALFETLSLDAARGGAL